MKETFYNSEARQAAGRIYKEEREFVNQAFETGFDGSQAAALGKEAAKYAGRAYGVPLSSGTAALHLALKLAAERLYGSASGISTPGGLGCGGALYGKRVFCPDFAALEFVSPVIYEGGEPIFIDCGETNWSMDQEVLELAFGKYPDVKIVIMNHAYGFPGQVMEIKEICHRYGALLIEDCSESFGAEVWTGGSSSEDRWCRTGSFGDYAVLDFGPGRIITGGTGGMLLTDDRYSMEKALYWASGARASAPWNQHEELGYSYRMSDLTAAAVRGQLMHLPEILERKRVIYERYVDRLEGDLAFMAPIEEGTRPNYWMSCMTVESGIGFLETRNERDYTYAGQHGTVAPMEIIEALDKFYRDADSCSSLWNSRALYKPLSLQPIFQNNEAVTLDGGKRSYRYFYEDVYRVRCHRAKEYFESGICLPSDAGMTEGEQEKVTEVILGCYNKCEGVRSK